LLARENTLQTRTLIATRLETLRPEFTRRLTGKLLEDMPPWRGNLWKLKRHYEEWLDENLTRELAEVSRREHRHFFGTLDRAYRMLNRSMDAFRVRLGKNIEEVLGVKLTETKWEITVAEPSRPDVAFTKVFDFHLDLLCFVIPMVIFRKVFEHHFLKEIPRVVEINLSRLAYQWEIRVNKAIEGMRDQALRYIEEELATINALLSKTTGGTEEIQKAIDGLENRLIGLTE